MREPSDDGGLLVIESKCYSCGIPLELEPGATAECIDCAEQLALAW